VRFREGRVAHDRDRGALLALGQDLEEEFGGSLVEVDVAELIDREEVESAVAGDGLGEVELVGCLGEFVGELGAGDVADPVAVLGCGDAGADEEVGLAGAGIPKQDNGF
jgi:hypothetical protein